MAGKVTLSGILLDPLNKPLPGVHIELKSVKTGDVISGIASEFVTNQDGSYSVDVPVGSYKCAVIVKDRETSLPGYVNVYEYSGTGTLNEYLYAPCQEDGEPMFIVQWEMMRQWINDKVSNVEQEIRDNLSPLGNLYSSIDEANSDLSNIPSGATVYVRSGDVKYIAVEYINNNGTLEPTGKNIASAQFIESINDRISFDSDGLISSISDSEGSCVFAVDDFGGINFPGGELPIHKLELIELNSSPSILTLTDSENAAFQSVDCFGDSYFNGVPVAIRKILSDFSSQTNNYYKRKMIYHIADFNVNPKKNVDYYFEIQSAIDRIFSLGGGYLYFPTSKYKISKPLIPRKGVHIIGDGMYESVFMPTGYLPAFQYRGDGVYIEDLFFCDIGVNGENQVIHPSRGYIPDIKGIFLQYYRNSFFNRINISNTGATGFGVDMPDNVFVSDSIVEGCGRLAEVGNLGASGFGLGTGKLELEPIYLKNITGRNNKNFGIFFEPQLGQGSAQMAIVTDSSFYGNHAGLADCGIQGLIASNLNLYNNDYGFLADEGTNFGGRPGHNGKLSNIICSKNKLGGMRFKCTKNENLKGFYEIDNCDVRDNIGDGLSVEYLSSVKLKGLSVTNCRFRNNTGNGVNLISGSAENINISSSRFIDNGSGGDGYGVRSNVPIDSSRISFNSFYCKSESNKQKGPVLINGDVSDSEISYNHCVGNESNDIVITGNKTNVKIESN